MDVAKLNSYYKLTIHCTLFSKYRDNRENNWKRYWIFFIFIENQLKDWRSVTQRWLSNNSLFALTNIEGRDKFFHSGSWYTQKIPCLACEGSSSLAEIKPQGGSCKKNVLCRILDNHRVQIVPEPLLTNYFILVKTFEFFYLNDLSIREVQAHPSVLILCNKTVTIGNSMDFTGHKRDFFVFNDPWEKETHYPKYSHLFHKEWERDRWSI